MKSILIRREKKDDSELVQWLLLIYLRETLENPISLEEAITLAVKKMKLQRFEALALYYKAKQKLLIQVECQVTQKGSLTNSLFLTGKGARFLRGVCK